MSSLSKNLAKQQAHIGDIADGLSFSGDGAFIDEGKLYLNCLFDNVDWGEKLISNVQFVNCKFVTANFVGCVFDACLFENVFFEDTVCFVHSRLDDCSFVNVVGGDYKFESSVLISNVWGGLKASSIEVVDTRLSTNVWNSVEAEKLVFRASKLGDHVFSGTRCKSFFFDMSYIERVFIGDSVISQCCLLGGGGQMLRFLNSNVQTFDVNQVSLMQFALVDSLVNVFVVNHAQLPLMQMQGCHLQKWKFSNCIATDILLDDVFLASWDMDLLELKGGLLNRVSMEMVDAGRVVWVRVKAKDVSLNDIRCKNFVIKNSDFSGLSQQKWKGVDFRKVIFSESITEEEKQWWVRFECGGSTF